MLVAKLRHGGEHNKTTYHFDFKLKHPFFYRFVYVSAYVLSSIIIIIMVKPSSSSSSLFHLVLSSSPVFPISFVFVRPILFHIFQNQFVYLLWLNRRTDTPIWLRATQLSSVKEKAWKMFSKPQQKRISNAYNQAMHAMSIFEIAVWIRQAKCMCVYECSPQRHRNDFQLFHSR